ncbi:PREDICTED: male-specific lethal 1 homolog isoform X2 [Nicrophorus vespilloides]|uniref:Male-specific lethal 1 homolog isoform X2 n=1 Tax=Nicrophorus vespilloides TaxID=110193 RepID=A0ABM1MXX0_NICVS|nr:PREDICTED: male-specific lethal 1 homolog isoform X2 [Nicrophorus vespilloides]
MFGIVYPSTRGRNNEHNIRERAEAKMSDHFCEQNNAKLSNSVENLEYFQQDIGDSIRGEEINHSYDHMYATNHEENGITEEPQTTCQTSESEVNFLKEFLLIHLDLIQQQNDDIINKENTIFILQQENARLREQLNCMESGLAGQSSSNFEITKSPHSSPASSTEDMTPDLGPIEEQNIELVPQVPELCLPSETVDEAKVYNDISINDDSQTQPELNVKEEPDEVNPEVTVVEPEIVVSEDTEEDNKPLAQRRDNSESGNLANFAEASYTIHSNTVTSGDPMKNLKMSIRRKRFYSNSSAVSNNDSASEEKKNCRRHSRKRRKRSIAKNDEFLTSDEQYVTQVGDESLDIIRRQELAEEAAKAATSNLEVPRWRVKVYTSCYTMEGTENLEDEAFLRRHTRLENDERRRKRWDVQRIREQRIVEKLKQRQDRIDANNRGSEQTETVDSLWPCIDDIKYIELCDSLPVSAFGCLLPKLPPSEFSLPWLTNPAIKKTIARKQSGRRRGTKR